VLNVALFGPPGAGKGTQSQFLVEEFNLFYISTGDLLRKELAAETRLGQEARSIIASGGLVSDEIIVQVMDHLFGIGLCTTTLVGFVGNLAGYYASTEAALLRAILQSDFVHVDETKINIQGVDHYVWVFTDGKHVVFRMTETREASIVRDVLAGYQGVLVSDFYPGYDSMPCRQQKCLVHLVRDGLVPEVHVGFVSDDQAVGLLDDAAHDVAGKPLAGGVAGIRENEHARVTAAYGVEQRIRV
jgi:hypothetical protein